MMDFANLFRGARPIVASKSGNAAKKEWQRGEKGLRGGGLF